MFKKKLSSFLKDTSGAITVNWIVLTAAVVALAAVTVVAIQSRSEGLADNAGTYLENYPFF